MIKFKPPAPQMVLLRKMYGHVLTKRKYFQDISDEGLLCKIHK